MRKTNALAGILAVGILACLALVSLPRKPRMVPGTQAPAPAFRMSMDARRNALLDRYELNLRKLDSLARDSGAISEAERKVTQGLLQAARTRSDHTQYALDLLGRADTADPAAWEVIRAAAQDSLDSLERYLELAPTASLLPKEGSLRTEAPGPAASR